MSKQHLYEKIAPGDRRTVVKKFAKGEKLHFADKSVIVLKSHVAMKVTQEWDPLLGRGDWVDKSYDINSMVEIDSPYERPEPTAMPGPGMRRDGKIDPVDLPIAELRETRRPWWRFW